MTPADILTPRNTEHPFRLFFPLACLGAWVALLPWLALLLAPQYAGHFPLHWHAFAFLNLCAGAGFVGFLMTALPAWTDDPAPRSIHSYLLLALWATMLFAMPWPRLALFACDAFWLYLSAYTAWRVIHNRRRNLVSFVITMSILTALSLCYSQNASGATLHQMVDTMLIAVALVNFRVGRVLGNEALKDGGHDALRFIPNPYWVPELRHLTGRDAPVADYLARQPEVAQMQEHIASFLQTWLPRLAADHRSYVTVAIGCTGGQHRSVYLAEQLAHQFAPRWSTLARHRELG